MVNWNNYEEYMLLHTDGELGEAEVKELMDFIKVHPDLSEELERFRSVKLAPDMTMVYPFKGELLRKEQLKTIAMPRNWMYYGAAAGVALLVLVMLPWNRQPNNNNVAKTVPVSHQTELVKTVPNEPYQTSTVKEPANNTTPNTIAAIKNTVAQTPASGTIDKPARQIEKTQLETMNSNTGMLASRNPEPTALSPKQLPEPGIQAVAIEEETTQEKQEFLAWLPIAEEKKQGLESIRNDLSDRLANAKAVRDEIKGADVVVRLGNRDLFKLNF
jgi:hypothetical protein